MTASYSVVTFFPHVFRIQKQVHLPFGRGASCTLIDTDTGTRRKGTDFDDYI
jgi:3D (Asp-Asp-Asp) domain-containing protein